ncbi:MAG: hypothetical protein V4439_04040 [Patescibacteria group bacterium]
MKNSVFSVWATALFFLLAFNKTNAQFSCMSNIHVSTGVSFVVDCSNQKVVTFTTDSLSRAYSWMIGSTPLGVAISMTVTITTPGDYNITATDTMNSWCYDVVQIHALPRPVTVVNVNVPGSTVIGNTTFVCSNPNGYSLNGNTTGVSYYWDNGPGPLIRHVFQGGVYIFTGVDSYGCTTSDTVNLVIWQSPTPAIIGNVPVCSGSSLVLSVDSPTIYSSVNWSGVGTSGNSPTASVNTTINYASYIVDMTATDANGCSATTTALVTVKPTPLTPTVFSTSPVACKMYDIHGGNLYQWMMGSGAGSIIPGATSSVYYPTSPNYYWVVETDIVSGCGSASLPLWSDCNIASGVDDELDKKDKLKISSEGISIEFADAEIHTVKVIDGIGQVVATETSSTEILFRNIKPGIYFLRVDEKPAVKIAVRQ